VYICSDDIYLRRWGLLACPGVEAGNFDTEVNCNLKLSAMTRDHMRLSYMPHAILFEKATICIATYACPTSTSWE